MNFDLAIESLKSCPKKQSVHDTFRMLAHHKVSLCQNFVQTRQDKITDKIDNILKEMYPQKAAVVANVRGACMPVAPMV